MPSITIPSFEFEDGSIVTDVEIVYDTWGNLDADADNAVIACHTLTGNTDVSEWWEPLLGPGKTLDTECYFVICASVIGSPYGRLSPLTINRETGRRFGPDFPDATVRDTVRLHRYLLDHLGVRGVEFAIGASLGAMQVLEWAILDERVRGIVPIAAGASHSAWGIGWSETQRQCIYADPKWNGGWYDPSDPPADGLANARMVAMLSYRSSQANNARFGRETVNRDGETIFDVESYLRYQGKKLVDRFDANCYVSLTKQMNSHDVGRGREGGTKVLGSLSNPGLVVGITSDILYPLAEQEELARELLNAELKVIDAPHGHDSFLIEIEELNRLVKDWIERELKSEARCHAA